MDIFYEGKGNEQSNYDNLYKQILSNQISYSFKDKDSILVEDEKLKNQSNKENHEINHESEALIGNFAPSIVLLNENKININDSYNKEGDSLLHLSCQFLDYTTIRTLIEKFGADINLKNKTDKTPFYMVCNNKKYDPNIISYFLKNKDLQINEEDVNGITPLLLSIKNKHINLFYALCSINPDLSHTDKDFHDAFYYALKYDNLPVLKYLLKYSNKDLFSSNNNLTPILVTSEGSKCCKYLFKYHYKKVINGITQPLKKENYQQYEFNLFNYELISTFYNNNISNIIVNFYKIISPNSKYNFKFYNLKYLILYLFIRKKFSDYTLRKCCLFYYNIILFLYTYFYIDFRQFYFNIYDLFSLLTTGFTVAFSYILLIKNTPEKNQFFYEKAFNPSYDKKNDSILGICEDAYKNNILDLPGIGEDCPKCLTKKRRNIQHCNKCDACVLNFHFHSNLLGICINSDNILNYSLLNCIFGFKQLSFINLLYNIIEENPKINGCFSFYKFLYVLFEGNILIKLFSILLFFNGSICIGIAFSALFCIGYNVSYYLTFRQHKITYGRIVQRKIYSNFIDYLAPIVNIIGVPQFCNNIFKKREIEFV